MTKNMRNHGLDIVRSIAIMLVLICHLNVFILIKNPHLKSIINTVQESFFIIINPVIGWLGVELFFVLSGFLIGQILIKTFILNKNYNINSLLTFYSRRWLRTLPLYYLLLIVNIVYFSNNQPVSFISSYFIFFQNFFGDNYLNFMVESWSLVIEEWFYLLFPVFILLLKKIYKNFSPRSFLKFLILFITAITIARCFYVGLFNPNFREITGLVFLRLDSLALGVLLAYLYLFNTNIYNFLCKKIFFFLALFTLFGVNYLYFYSVAASPDMGFLFDEPWNNSFLAKTLMYNAVSISFAIIVCHFEKLKIKQIKFFTTTSKISYSIYLTNLPILTALHPFIEKLTYNNTDWIIPLYLLLIVIIYSVSYLTYKLYEKPIMNFRDSKFIKKLLNCREEKYQEEQSTS